MFRILPTDHEFFVLFEKASQNILEGAEVLKELLDNFENVVDAEKGQVRDAELDEALRAFLRAETSAGHEVVVISASTGQSPHRSASSRPAVRASTEAPAWLAHAWGTAM